MADAKLTLGEKQRLFCTVLVPQLLNAARVMGYELTFGDAFRDPRATFPYGRKTSLHRERLAVDLNLFRNGRFLQRTEDHEELGVFWEALGEKYGVVTSWGGRFDEGDGNHYSVEHNGRR